MRRQCESSSTWVWVNPPTTNRSDQHPMGPGRKGRSPFLAFVLGQVVPGYMLPVALTVFSKPWGGTDFLFKRRFARFTTLRGAIAERQERSHHRPTVRTRFRFANSQKAKFHIVPWWYSDRYVLSMDIYYTR